MTEVARRVDALFANSSTETKTSSEQAFAQGWINQIGNVGAIITAIVSAVFFTMLLVTANTMAQSIRERTAELAVMKTLGFSGPQVLWLVLAESVLITLIGGALGLVLSTLVVSGASRRWRSTCRCWRYRPGVPHRARLHPAASACCPAPCPPWQAWRLNIVTRVAALMTALLRQLGHHRVDEPAQHAGARQPRRWSRPSASAAWSRC